MTLSKSSWIETTGIFAIILSLVFVGFELRQNTRIAEAQALSELNALSNENLRLRLETPGLAELRIKWRQAPEDLSELEQDTFQAYWQSVLNAYENAFMFYDRGIIDEIHFEVWSKDLCKIISDTPLAYRMMQDGYFGLQIKFENHVDQSCQLSN
jgi:hypothetical protein